MLGSEGKQWKDCFHNLALQSFLLCSETSLSFGFYVRELVGGAKQAVVQKQALILFCGGGV